MKIVVYPISDNPYQKLLYANLHTNHEVLFLRNKIIDVKRAFVFGMPLFPLRFLLLRLKGWKILHLHWLLAFVLPGDNYLFRIISTLYVISFILWIKLLGYKLVWTLHEILPHKTEFINDSGVRKFISIMSDATIYHSPSALEEATNVGFSMQKAHIIPMGNFMTTYKNTIAKKEARSKLSIKENDFVFLFFGLIKPYKGVIDLLRAFDQFKTQHPTNPTKLLIAGRSEDNEADKALREYKQKHKDSLIVMTESVADDYVQVLLNASDVVVLPYKKNTSSSAALLAFSFKKPIIAPLIGSFKDLPKKGGFYYTGSDLLVSMQKAYADKKHLPEMGEFGYKEVKKLSWENASKLTEQVYQHISR
jgi:glycosyltransferase involved in cell wall biosynthesis